MIAYKCAAVLFDASISQEVSTAWPLRLWQSWVQAGKWLQAFPQQVALGPSELIMFRKLILGIFRHGPTPQPNLKKWDWTSPPNLKNWTRKFGQKKHDR